MELPNEVRKFSSFKTASEVCRYHPGAYVGEGHHDKNGPYFTVERRDIGIGYNLVVIMRTNGTFK
jgi:hypothetical protein